MSARRPVLRLATAAGRDIESILALTEVTWGVQQAADYQAAINQTFELLRDHPLLGQPRDDLFPGYRSVKVQQHIIYYQPREREIRVVRILHHRQEPVGKVQGTRSRTITEP